MAKSRTTNVAYYFARRKDTGMAGVWFTHCATFYQKNCVIHRLARKCNVPASDFDDLSDLRFKVSFLEDNFESTVKEFCKHWDISIAFDLTLKVIQESNPEIKTMP